MTEDMCFVYSWVDEIFHTVLVTVFDSIELVEWGVRAGLRHAFGDTDLKRQC